MFLSFVEEEILKGVWVLQPFCIGIGGICEGLIVMKSKVSHTLTLSLYEDQAPKTLDPSFPIM